MTKPSIDITEVDKVLNTDKKYKEELEKQKDKYESIANSINKNKEP